MLELPQRIRLTAVMLIGFVLLASLSACSSLSGAYRAGQTLQQFQGRLLRVAPGTVGDQCIGIWREADPAIDRFVGEQGSPDYVLVSDLYVTQFVYVEPPRLITFRRWFADIWSLESKLVVTNGLPSTLNSLMAPLEEN